MSRILLVIDAQPGFPSARKPELIRNICREIKLAKKRQAGIVLCEYVGYGRTNKKIRDSIGDYTRLVRCRKKTDDGSSLVYHYSAEAGFDVTTWRVCGVNIAFCVNTTVKGLRKLLPNADVQIKQDACNCVLNKERSWKRFNKHNGTVKRL
jgi:hypothetical protein